MPLGLSPPVAELVLELFKDIGAPDEVGITGVWHEDYPY
jgi:hypothetical protein